MEKITSKILNKQEHRKHQKTRKKEWLERGKTTTLELIKRTDWLKIKYGGEDKDQDRVHDVRISNKSLEELARSLGRDSQQDNYIVYGDFELYEDEKAT